MKDEQINEIMALGDSYANAFVSDMPRARAAIESALRAVPAIPEGWVGSVIVGHAPHHGGYCVFEETAPGEF